MLNLGFPAVLVGNASEEVKNKDWPPTVYLARSSYAAGIWEGLQQWNKALRPIERPSLVLPMGRTLDIWATKQKAGRTRLTKS